MLLSMSTSYAASNKTELGSEERVIDRYNFDVTDIYYLTSGEQGETIIVNDK